MAKAGAFIRDDRPRRVDNMVSAATGGWVEIAKVPRSALPTTGGRRPYSFWVTGDVGRTGVNNAGVVRNTVIEIALGRSGSSANAQHIYPNFIFRMSPLNPSTLGSQNGAIPFSFLFNADVYENAAGWDTTNDDLAVKARVYRNGDVAAASASAIVGYVWALAWDHSALDAGKFFTHDWTGGTTLAQNTNTAPRTTPNWQTLTESPAFGVKDDEWLAFASIEYLPNSTTHAPWLRVTQRDSASNVLGMVGRSVFSGVFGGKSPTFLKGSTAPEGSFAKFHFGGFSATQLPTDSCKFGLQGSDVYNAAGAADRTKVTGFHLFAINLDQLTFVQRLTESLTPSNFAVPPGLLSNQYNGAKTAEVEFTNTRYTDYVTLFKAMPGRVALGNQFLFGFGIGVTVDETHQLSPGWNKIAGTRDECWPNLVAVQDTQFRPNLTELTFRSFEMGTLPTSFLGHSAETEVVGFFLERNPDLITFPDEVPGPEIEIIPGREAPNVSTLSTPPQAVQRFDVEPELRRGEFRPDMAYTITVPLFMVVRQNGTFVWEGLTLGERESLTTWVYAQSTRAFAATLPKESTARAFAFAAPPQVSQSDNYWTVSVAAIELVFTE